MLVLPWEKPATCLLRNLIGWHYFSPSVKVLSPVDSKPNFVTSIDHKCDSQENIKDIYSDLYINSAIETKIKNTTV